MQWTANKKIVGAWHGAAAWGYSALQPRLLLPSVWVERHLEPLFGQFWWRITLGFGGWRVHVNLGRMRPSPPERPWRGEEMWARRAKRQGQALTLAHLEAMIDQNASWAWIAQQGGLQWHYGWKMAQRECLDTLPRPLSEKREETHTEEEVTVHPLVERGLAQMAARPTTTQTSS